MTTPPAYGMAVAAEEIVVVSPDGATTWRRPLGRPAGDEWSTVSELLAVVQRESRHARRSANAAPLLRVALLPHFAEVREVSLPPINADDAVRVLQRGAARFFLDTREPLVAGVTPVAEGSTPGALSARVVAGVGADTLQALRAAAARADFQIDVVVPAMAAWCRAAPAGTAAVVANTGSSIDVIAVAAGVPQSLRRFRTAGDEAVLEDVLTARCAAGGTTYRVADAAWAAAHALTLPSRGSQAAASWPLALGAPAQRARRTRSAGALAQRALVAVLVVMVLAAPVLWEWQTARALHEVHAARTALAPSLAALEPMRTVRAQAAVVGAAGAHAGYSWTPALLALGHALPDDAWVTGLRAVGDTLVIEGRATEAASAFDALQASPLLRSIAATAPVQRESGPDGLLLDRFVFSVRRGAAQ